MKKFWQAGDRSRAICEQCGVVETRFEYRTVSLEKPRVDVPDVLVAVCTVCDQIAAVPYQSSPRLNEARKAADMVKGAIIAAAEDLETQQGEKRREILAEMAASV